MKNRTENNNGKMKTIMETIVKTIMKKFLFTIGQFHLNELNAIMPMILCPRLTSKCSARASRSFISSRDMVNQSVRPSKMHLLRLVLIYHVTIKDKQS